MTHKPKLIDSKQMKIKALLHAKGCLQRGDKEYICHGLDDFVDNYFCYTVTPKSIAVASLKKYIISAMGFDHQWGSIEVWLSKEGICSKKIAYKYRHKVRRTRLNWIDWMINCLQEDIDKLKAKQK